MLPASARSDGYCRPPIVPHPVIMPIAATAAGTMNNRFIRLSSNVRVQTEARFGADSLEPLVRSLCFSKVDVLNGIASVEKDKEGSG